MGDGVAAGRRTGEGRGGGGRAAHAPGHSQQAGQRCRHRRAGGQEQTAGFKSLEKTATNTSDKKITTLSRADSQITAQRLEEKRSQCRAHVSVHQ